MIRQVHKWLIITVLDFLERRKEQEADTALAGKQTRARVEWRRHKARLLPLKGLSSPTALCYHATSSSAPLLKTHTLSLTPRRTGQRAWS